MTERVSVDALVYEALQKIFRNAVVGHLRDILTSVYPTTWSNELRKPFKSEEWEGIIQSVEAMHAARVTDRDTADDFDCLSVNHFYNLFDCHFKQLVPADELPVDEYLPKLRQQVLGWLRDIKALRDPVAHPATQELPAMDAVRVVDAARRVLALLHLRSAAEEVSAICAVLIARSYEPSSSEILALIDDSLPAPETIVVDFVGRQDELADLRAWFADPGSRRWLLSGDGGKGKTTIAYKFAGDVRGSAPDWLCGVFWLSAKRRRFEEGVTLEISSPDFWDLDSALSKILSDYGWNEDCSKSVDAKRLTVLGLLDEFPSLIVIDDLDSIPPEEEDVVEFLTLDACRSRSKLLFTSRRQLIGMGKTTTVVEGLDENEGIAFIESRMSLMALPEDLMNLDQRRRVVRVCEGSPLYIEDLLRFCKFLKPSQAISSWEQNRGEEVRKYALAREMEMLSEDAQEVLAACSLAGSMTVLELEKVTGLSEERVITAVDELRRMYLVPAPDLIERVPRYQVNRNLRILVTAAIKGTPQRLRLDNALLAISGKDFARDSDVGAFCRQARVLVEAGRLDEAEATMKAGLDRYPNHRRLLGMLGWVYKQWIPRRVVDARAAWERADQLGSAERPMFVHWSSMEAEEGRWRRSAEVAELGAERCSVNEKEDWQLLAQAGFARSKLAQELRASLNEERARQEFDSADYALSRAVKRAHEVNAPTLPISRAFRSWVINARARGDAEGVCTRLLEWLQWNPEAPFVAEEVARSKNGCPDVRAFIGGTARAPG